MGVICVQYSSCTAQARANAGGIMSGFLPGAGMEKLCMTSLVFVMATQPGHA